MTLHFHSKVEVKQTHSVKPSEKSYEKFFRPFDMDGYRRRFPDLWRAFLKAHFRDATHVAFVFGVTDRTAQNWLHGIGSPRPEFVLMALKYVPAAQSLLDDVA